MNYFKCNSVVLGWRDGHETPCKDCKPLEGEKSVKRAQGLAVLKGQNLVVYSCPDACVKCNTEERGSLWVTTTEAPKRLEDLLDTTDSGQK